MIIRGLLCAVLYAGIIVAAVVLAPGGPPFVYEGF